MNEGGGSPQKGAHAYLVQGLSSRLDNVCQKALRTVKCYINVSSHGGMAFLFRKLGDCTA